MPSKKATVKLTEEFALLAERITEFRIPPWPGQAQFERVLIYRIPDEGAANEKFGEDSLIFKPDSRKAVDVSRSPRGVIVSAGLQAMDILRGNGMQIGDLVWFAPHVPTRFETGRDDRGPIEFFFMNVGDIVVDEDTLARVVDGDLSSAFTVDGRHAYSKKGELLDRKSPATYPDDI
jgi:hypothetical protein